MLEFFGAICAPSIWVIAVLEFALLVFMIVRYVKTKSIMTLVIAFITVGLFYDAFMIGLGTLDNIESLKGLSQFRFVSHGLLIPLLFVVGSLALDLKSPWKWVVYGVTLALMIAGVAEGFATNLVPNYALVDKDTSLYSTVVRYISFEPSTKKYTADQIATLVATWGDVTPSWASGISSLLSFGTVFPLMGVGIYLWIKEKNPFLFLSGFSMFFFSVFPLIIKANIFMFFISMFGEILMVTFMLVYTIKKEKKFI